MQETESKQDFTPRSSAFAGSQCGHLRVRPRTLTQTETMLTKPLFRLAQRRLPLAPRTLSSASSVPATKGATATPSEVQTTPASQAPNYPSPWSTSQRPRADALKEARFEQTALELQPQPLSAMQMIANEPVRLVHGRKAVCDGGASLVPKFAPAPHCLLSTVRCPLSTDLRPLPFDGCQAWARWGTRRS